jgi:hypothetical protein
MTFALVSGCGSTNPSERTDEVGQVLTIPPRSSARVFANRCVPTPPLCSTKGADGGSGRLAAHFRIR